MSVALSERFAVGLQQRPRPAWPNGPTHPGLCEQQNATIQADRWFATLSEPLRQAILGRARVCHAAAGTRLSRRGEAAAHWVGVAAGALRLGTSLSDGRDFTLDFIGPSQWFGDIALVDDGRLDLDLVAHVPSTLLMVSKPDLRGLIDSRSELRDALLQLNCRRLRHLYRRFEELHTLSLTQRLARQILRLTRRFGRPCGTGERIELAVSQSDLAALVAGSRQRINGAWRQMQHLGIVRRDSTRLVVLDQARLEAVADGRIVLAGEVVATRERP